MYIKIIKSELNDQTFYPVQTWYQVSLDQDFDPKIDLGEESFCLITEDQLKDKSNIIDLMEEDYSVLLVKPTGKRYGQVKVVGEIIAKTDKETKDKVNNFCQKHLLDKNEAIRCFKKGPNTTKDQDIENFSYCIDYNPQKIKEVLYAFENNIHKK